MRDERADKLIDRSEFADEREILAGGRWTNKLVVAALVGAVALGFGWLSWRGRAVSRAATIQRSAAAATTTTTPPAPASVAAALHKSATAEGARHRHRAHGEPGARALKLPVLPPQASDAP